MNILLKLKKKMRDYISLESAISMYIGKVILNDIKTDDPHVHYFEVKKFLFSKKITVVIYCGRPGLLIGSKGCHLDKLKFMITAWMLGERINNMRVNIEIVEYEPVRIIDCDQFS